MLGRLSAFTQSSVLSPSALGPQTSVPAVELDPVLDLADGVVDQANGRGAVTPLVSFRLLQRAPRLAQVLEGGLHVRLVRAGAAGEEAGTDGKGYEKRGEKTACIHGQTPFF